MSTASGSAAPTASSHAAVHAEGLGKRYRDVAAVEGVDLHIAAGTVTGLLGRNGAGKSTLLRLITGQARPDAGSVTVFGRVPFENDRALDGICFVGESQVYPDTFRVRDVRTAGRLAYPAWDDELAGELCAAFALPSDRPVQKLSRGMRSAVGIMLAVASRAPLTLLDEPYLGLDAVARRTFYDRLLADYAEHPRTIVISTHLIDEVSDLLQCVVLIDRGRILLDEDAESLRGSAVLVSGARSSVEAFAEGRDAVHVQSLGAMSRATLRGVGRQDQEQARGRGLTVEALSLQDLVVDLTSDRPAPNGAAPLPEKESR